MEGKPQFPQETDPGCAPRGPWIIGPLGPHQIALRAISS